MSEHGVVIVGGGPTGLMLAAELALAGVEAVIVERRRDQDILGSRAGGLHSRTIEIFDQRGIADRFLAEGQKAQVTGFAGVSFDLSAFPTRHNYSLGLWQRHIERILAGWVAELGVSILRGHQVVSLQQDADGLDLRLADGSTLRSRYVVGCDGGRSFVRKAAGIDFPGTEPTTSNIIAEVELADPPAEWGIRRTSTGIHSLGRVDYTIRDGKIIYADEGPVGVLVTDAQVSSGEPSFEELRAAVISVYGTDYGMHSPRSITRFTDATRQAATYREGRVLVAGDAAHIHPPDGGQGLQTGVQDAVNLGWKLGQVVRGVSPDSLLDTYHAERHPVAARVLRNTLAAVALRRDDDRARALRETMAELLGMDEPRRHFAGMMAGLDIHYDLGSGHKLLGRRMPDLDITVGGQPQRVFELLHRGRPVLLEFGGTDRDIGPWQDRVVAVQARFEGEIELPVIGPVPSPEAVLIRPDGYVAWAGEGGSAGLREALTAWCGPAG